MLRLYPIHAPGSLSASLPHQGLVAELERRGAAAGARVLAPVPLVTGEAPAAAPGRGAVAGEGLAQWAAWSFPTPTVVLTAFWIYERA